VNTPPPPGVPVLCWVHSESNWVVLYYSPSLGCYCLDNKKGSLSALYEPEDVWKWQMIRQQMDASLSIPGRNRIVLGYCASMDVWYTCYYGACLHSGEVCWREDYGDNPVDIDYWWELPEVEIVREAIN